MGFSDSARYYFVNLHRKYKGNRQPQTIRFTNDRNHLRTADFYPFPSYHAQKSRTLFVFRQGTAFIPQKEESDSDNSYI